MKVLIVDDEIFTREGIISMIPWSNFGISQIEQAFDGVNALQIAENFKPDILLTDVRMPRMDGIELSFKLREMYPSCEIIFLSGYSDKDYLKSAIKLKAVSYVEKPIDLEELENALKNAVALKSQEFENNEKQKSSLALELLDTSADYTKLKYAFENLTSRKSDSVSFVTVLIQVCSDETLDNDSLKYSIEEIVLKNNLNCISSFKEDNVLILHLFSDKNNYNLHNVLDAIYSYMKAKYNFYICVGKIVAALNEIVESYYSAKYTLKRTFFYNYNSIIHFDKINTSIYNFDEKVINSFLETLKNEDAQNCILMINRLTSEISDCEGSPVNSIKDIYYKLYLKLINFSTERRINLNEKDVPFEYFSSFQTLFEIKAFLIDKVEYVFTCLKQRNFNLDPINIILDYIHENYSDVDLSLQKISSKTYLTSAYICSIFKEHTGKTINSYITGYRINKAKELLKVESMKIVDITSQVGYSDGNYFAKIFKKETGLTPSEYRRKFLI